MHGAALDALVPDSELSHLQGDVYLDYAGAGVYCQEQVRLACRDLTEGGLGNPHSTNRGGERSRARIAELRQAILTHFGAEESYTAVLTSGATGSLKLIGNTFAFTEGSEFAVLEFNHNSVLGIRGCCASKGGTYRAIPLEEFPLPPRQAQHTPPAALSLMAAPLVCNFSGLVIPTTWCGAARRAGYTTLVDAACAFGKRRITLTEEESQPDYLVGSFYKAFGMPTGMGFLLIRKGCEQHLKPAYFGGGTLHGASAHALWEDRKGGVAESLEDGTVSFLDAGVALQGLRHLDTLGLPAIEARIARLTQELAEALRGLHHPNGTPLCRLMGHGIGNKGQAPGDATTCLGMQPGIHSSIVAFSVQDASGGPVGYNAVVEVANAHRIHIRGGCFCNPGACHRFLGISLDDAKAHRAAGHVCGDAMDVVEGKPTGAVRASIGIYTMPEDIASLAACLRDAFIPQNDCAPPAAAPAAGGIVESITLYPVKGACGVAVPGPWPVCQAGLVLDRQWCVVRRGTRIPLSRKQLPGLGDIQPEVCPEQGVVLLTHAPSGRRVALPLAEGGQVEAGQPDVSVRGTRHSVGLCSGEASAWLSEVLGCPGLQLCCRGGGEGRPSLSNTSAFLVVNASSVEALAERVGVGLDVGIFRANLVLRGAGPWEEDRWGGLAVGGVVLSETEACVRCTQINIGAQEVADEPLRTLMHTRRRAGKALFGVGAMPAAAAGGPLPSADEAIAAILSLAEGLPEHPSGKQHALSLHLPGFPSVEVGGAYSVTSSCPSMLG